MFSQIAEHSRNQLTSWFLKVQSETKHKTSDIKLERIITKPWDIVKTRLQQFYQQTLEFYQITSHEVSTLEDIEEQLEAYKHQDIPKEAEREISIKEAKLLLLTQACIGLNELVFNRIVEIATDVDDHVQQWTKMQDQHLWLLLEKTPWYWFKYFFGSIQILSSETSTTISGMDHPKIEAAKKLTKLSSLEEHLLIFLGVGNKVLSCFESASQLEEEQARSQHLHVLMFLSQKIMEYFFDLQNMEEEISSPREIGGVKKAAKRYKDEVPSRLFEIPPDVLEGNSDVIFTMLEKNLSRALQFELDALKILDENARPTFLSSNWFQLTVGALLIYVITSEGASSYIYSRQAVISDLVQDAYVSGVNFFVRYVQEPMVAIYKTIRYEKTFAVIDPKAMESEVDSLVNMITDFVKKVQPTLTPQQLVAVQEQARAGDLSRILPHYEAAINSPIKESVFGDLIQMLLIQIQKERVEISRAMFALDKLLKANELNFEALGMIPAVIAGIAGIQITSRYIIGRISTPTLYRQIRTQIRNIERLLTANVNTITILNKAAEEQAIQGELVVEDYNAFVSSILNNDMSFENIGRLMIHLNTLKKYAQGLSAKYKAMFLEDIHDLEQFNNVRRFATINRMFHFYPFLVPQ